MRLAARPLVWVERMLADLIMPGVCDDEDDLPPPSGTKPAAWRSLKFHSGADSVFQV